MDRRRGPGRRRGEVRRAAEEGEITGELLEFIMAIDSYKTINERPFPSWSEVFEIVQYLGYRKVAPRAEHINSACGPVVLESNAGGGQVVVRHCGNHDHCSPVPNVSPLRARRPQRSAVVNSVNCTLRSRADHFLVCHGSRAVQDCTELIAPRAPQRSAGRPGC